MDHKKIYLYWIFVTLSSYLTIIESIFVVPPNAITYEPPHIESSIFLI